jgi:hypothetical protein
MTLVPFRSFKVPSDVTHSIYVVGTSRNGIRQHDKIARDFVNHSLPELNETDHVILVWGGDQLGPAEKPTAGNLAHEVFKCLKERGARVTAIAAKVEEHEDDFSSLLHESHPMKPIVVPLHPILDKRDQIMRAGVSDDIGLCNSFGETPVGTTAFFYHHIAIETEREGNTHVLLSPGGHISSQEAICFYHTDWISVYPYDKDDPENGLVEPLTDLQFAMTVHDLMTFMDITDSHHHWTDKHMSIIRNHGGTMFIHELQRLYSAKYQVSHRDAR